METRPPRPKYIRKRTRRVKRRFSPYYITIPFIALLSLALFLLSPRGTAFAFEAPSAVDSYDWCVLFDYRTETFEHGIDPATGGTHVPGFGFISDDGVSAGRDQVGFYVAGQDSTAIIEYAGLWVRVDDSSDPYSDTGSSPQFGLLATSTIPLTDVNLDAGHEFYSTDLVSYSGDQDFLFTIQEDLSTAGNQDIQYIASAAILAGTGENPFPLATDSDCQVTGSALPSLLGLDGVTYDWCTYWDFTTGSHGWSISTRYPDRPNGVYIDDVGFVSTSGTGNQNGVYFSRDLPPSPDTIGFVRAGLHWTALNDAFIQDTWQTNDPNQNDFVGGAFGGGVYSFVYNDVFTANWRFDTWGHEPVGTSMGTYRWLSTGYSTGGMRVGYRFLEQHPAALGMTIDGAWLAGNGPSPFGHSGDDCTYVGDPYANLVTPTPAPTNTLDLTATYGLGDPYPTFDFGDTGPTATIDPGGGPYPGTPAPPGAPTLPPVPTVDPLYTPGVQADGSLNCGTEADPCYFATPFVEPTPTPVLEPPVAPGFVEVASADFRAPGDTNGDIAALEAVEYDVGCPINFQTIALQATIRLCFRYLHLSGLRFLGNEIPAWPFAGFLVLALVGAIIKNA